MKTFIQTIIIFCLASFMAQAQNLQSNFINYQGVASDASGNAIANTAINLQIALRFGSETATASYIETHNPTTDANGLFNIKIGNGTLVSGVYDSADFGINASYITVSLNGTVAGTTEFNAVPYALSSGDSYWQENSAGNAIFNTNSAVIISGALVLGGAVQFSTGAAITAFSNDGTLSGNSPTALSTENAVKTYVDNSIGAISNVSSIDDLSDGNTDNFSLFLGFSSGAAVTTGNRNVGLGIRALEDNTIGDFNTAVGYFTLKENTTGRVNTAIGPFSLDNNLTGEENTAIGLSSLGDNVSGNNNTAIGLRALFAALGSGNVALGNEAGRNETGSNKLYISNSSSSNPLIYGEFDNRTLRFNGTTEARSFSGSPTTTDLILGGTANTAAGDDGIISSDPDYAGSDIFLRSNDAVVIELDYDNNETGELDVNNGTGSNIFKLRETGNLTISGSLTQNSDRRLKKDIEKLPYGLREILQLDPKAYNWKDRDQDHKSLGLIAQEVQTIIAGLVTAKDDEQQTLGVNYIELIPVLINAIQEQQAQIETLKTKNNAKKVAMTQILLRLNNLETTKISDAISENEIAIKN